MVSTSEFGFSRIHVVENPDFDRMNKINRMEKGNETVKNMSPFGEHYLSGPKYGPSKRCHFHKQPAFNPNTEVERNF
jgi:hypothetical protein